MTTTNLLKNHVLALRCIAATLREKKESYPDQRAKELEARADEQEVYLILQGKLYAQV